MEKQKYQSRSNANLTESLGFLKFLEVVKKRKYLVIFSVLVCLMLSIVATTYMSPTYEATDQLLVSQGQATNRGQSSAESYQAVLLSERLTKTFSEIIRSRTLAKNVLKKLELSMSPGDLENKVRAEPVRDTQLILITVTDTSPVRAKDLANTYAKEFTKMVNRVIPSSAMISVNTVDQAELPHKPVNPKPVLNAVMAIIVGLMASIGFAIFLEMLDITVKESEEIEELTGLRSLGKIPGVKKPLLLNDDDAMISEASRKIRTNLQYLNFNRSIRTLAVSSPIMGDGKTTVSANLAVVLAQAGQKVLIVDCDLIRPSIHGVFQHKLVNQIDDTGIANVLIDASSAHSAILSAGIDGLSVMTSGPVPPNSADLLNSEQMDKLISDLKKDFDLIILDTPPVLTVADAAIVASKADALLLVSSYGKTKKSELIAAEDVLNKVGARIIGFVINKIHMSKSNSYYYYKSYTRRQVATRKKTA